MNPWATTDLKGLAPIMRYLLGRTDRAAVIAAANGAEEKRRKEHECEAHYYIASQLVGAGQGREARPLLERARDECPRNFVEYESALAELRRLPAQ